ILQRSRTREDLDGPGDEIGQPPLGTRLPQQVEDFFLEILASRNLVEVLIETVAQKHDELRPPYEHREKRRPDQAELLAIGSIEINAGRNKCLDCHNPIYSSAAGI